ncbi:uncharacterized protein DUF2851 [Mangrovibacterium diazotrophicum]|uniref:Uncharacterized protein DUF2851 n=2 Tax=Mangrovibacterium diazotrophicum TaxID=1261403 RepID=A0A419WBB3_9BACT|nr:uncharacterized protein DUF2851 [Mangrovibacterium diazotrophicum]
MNEFFLQFLWKHRLFNEDPFQTSSGQPIKVISPGFQNTDAGPDFFNARLKIGETTWAGNVEIHWRSSDWIKHKHEKDGAYDNVILHVVKEDDTAIQNSKGEHIECACLNYDEILEHNYLKLQKSTSWIPCADSIHRVPSITLQIWYHALMVERLQQKTAEITERLQQNNNDWNETFYQFLARNFGFKTNAVPFELLAKVLPLSILGKHKNDLFQLEALLYGTAGLLNEELVGDDYFLALRQEFSFLYKKYKLKPIEGHLWKFLRLRPVNFPTVRIAQFAMLVHQSTALFSHIIETEKLSDVKKLFQIEASSYWESHFKFNKLSKKQAKHLGDSAFFNLVINTLVPFLFVYGEYHKKQPLKDLALNYLEQIPAETNSIIANWAGLGIAARSAFDTQALIQLKNNYCNAKKCLNCPVGMKLIHHSNHEKHEPVDE